VTAPRFGFFFWPYQPDLVARMVRLGESQGWDLVGMADTPGNAMDVWVALAHAATLGAAADGAFVNHGLGAEETARARALLAEGAAQAGRAAGPFDTWFIACLDVSERRETALGQLGNILGFVAAYVLGPAPTARGVPADLVPAVTELRRQYTTKRRDMDPGLVRRLGLFDYLRARLAVAGTPDDCAEQVQTALAAGATNLMFTVSLAADPIRTVELFGRHVLPAVTARG
jgi:alkanesulfonate monooxygenase SsuD/methylene tetrahydromethanopterin reductase-like flavin-dependent oxidoreductase (luciferase family)